MWTGGSGGDNWCGTSVEFGMTGRSRVEWGVGTGVGSSVEMRTVTSGRNF